MQQQYQVAAQYQPPNQKIKQIQQYMKQQLNSISMSSSKKNIYANFPANFPANALDTKASPHPVPAQNIQSQNYVHHHNPSVSQSQSQICHNPSLSQHYFQNPEPDVEKSQAQII